MSLEDISAVERLLSRRTGPRTETADHGTLVVCQGMSVLVILPCETLKVIFASSDRALLWSLILVSEHVSF